MLKKLGHRPKFSGQKNVGRVSRPVICRGEIVALLNRVIWGHHVIWVKSINWAKGAGWIRHTTGMVSGLLYYCWTGLETRPTAMLLLYRRTTAKTPN